MSDKTAKPIRHVFITGASSGIGRALALAYAAVPDMALSLTGRNEERLRAAANECRALGAVVDEEVLCVTDQGSMEEYIQSRDHARSIDLIIANAGISAGMGEGQSEGPEQIRALFDVNVHGVFHTVHPALALMKKRGSGQIALMSSMAGFIGWPGAPAYCASKAAVKVYGEGLGQNLSGSGVSVHVIAPGFVKSRMTDVNDFPMPLLMEADKAAKLIVKKLAKGKSRIAFPWPVYAAVMCASLLPAWVLRRAFAGAPAKGQLSQDS